MLPIAVNRTVAVGAKQLRLVEGYFGTHGINERIPVVDVVAAEAVRVEPMLEHYVGVPEA
jgi:hypothetical protein